MTALQTILNQEMIYWKEFDINCKMIIVENKGDLRAKDIYTNGDLRYTMFVGGAHRNERCRV